MTTAACGRQQLTGGGSAATNKPHKEHCHLRKTKDSRRRQAALLFLNNISLDGRPLYNNLNHGNLVGQRDAGAGELLSRDPGGPVVPGAAAASSYGTFAHVSPPSGVPGGAATTTPAAPGTLAVSMSACPSTVTSPSAATGPAVFQGAAGLGSNEVFLENVVLGTGGDPVVAAPPDTPLLLLSPFPGAHQTTSTCHPGAKSPFPFSPVPSLNSIPAESRQRTRNGSGSPGPRVSKKVHFIKTMRQYDTRGSRIMLICAKRSLCGAFSVLPYGESFHLSDPKLEAIQRQRTSSGVTSDLLPALEGMQMGAYGKSVSYASLLFPTNALVRQKSSGGLELSAVQTPLTRYRGNGQKTITPSRLNSAVGQDRTIEDLAEYDPNLLSDPQWPGGRHKRVLIFASYVTTVIEYMKPSDLKKDMNETFRDKFPHIKLTLTKIRSLKRDMRAVSEECGLQPVTVAMAFVYFEKLVMQGRLNKQNRKLVSAACVLLAAKISSDLKKQEVSQLIDKLEERFRINRRELIPLEFPVLVALEMGLYLPDSKVMPHYRRLVQQQQG